VDHDLADRRVLEIPLDRSVAERLVDDLADELLALGIVERDLLLLQDDAQLAHDLRVELGRGARRLPQRGTHPPDQRLLRAALQLADRVRRQHALGFGGLGRPGRDGAERRRLVPRRLALLHALAELHGVTACGRGRRAGCRPGSTGAPRVARAGASPATPLTAGRTARSALPRSGTRG